MNDNIIHRGQMWWWKPSERQPEHIQEGERPVIIISNDECNNNSKVVTVVPCTTSNKNYYPQHTRIYLQERPTIILADQIRTIPKYELVNYKCTLGYYDMIDVECAVCKQLGLDLVRRV